VPRNGGPYELAFVLGGGGILGAHEVGMLQALAERSIVPDVVLGTSVGAINGALFASDPTLAGVERLSRLWVQARLGEITAGTVLRRVSTLARTGTHLQSLSDVHQRLAQSVPVQRIEQLQLRSRAGGFPPPAVACGPNGPDPEDPHVAVSG
jgi:NTE family protein